MMLAKLFHHPSRVLTGCCLLALSGCASNEVLNNQLASSREAVDQAKMAGAAETSPSDFQVALDKLDRANAAAKDRKEDDAMRLAQQAQVDANLARARTETAHANFAAAELQKSNQLLREVHQENQKSRGER